jgi:hypothetical protein
LASIAPAYPFLLFKIMLNPATVFRQINVQITVIIVTSLS